MAQRAEYSAASDTLTVYLLDSEVGETVALDPRRSLRYDAEGRLVQVEFVHPFAGGVNLADVPSARLVGALILESGHKFRMVE